MVPLNAANPTEKPELAPLPDGFNQSAELCRFEVPLAVASWCSNLPSSMAERFAVAAGGQHASLRVGALRCCCCSKRLRAPVPASAVMVTQQLACVSMRQPLGARLELHVAGESTRCSAPCFGVAVGIQGKEHLAIALLHVLVIKHRGAGRHTVHRQSQWSAQARGVNHRTVRRAGCRPVGGARRQRRRAGRAAAAAAGVSAAGAELLLAVPAAQDLRAAAPAGEALLALRMRAGPAVDGLADGLEAPVQLLYLLTLLGFLVVGAFLVVRQVRSATGRTLLPVIAGLPFTPRPACMSWHCCAGPPCLMPRFYQRSCTLEAVWSVSRALRTPSLGARASRAVCSKPSTLRPPARAAAVQGGEGLGVRAAAQVLVRRELEEAAKVLGERIRTSEATSEDCFELGAILLRKKLYTQATKNLERAIKLWDGAPEELAQARPAPCAAGPHCVPMGCMHLGMRSWRRQYSASVGQEPSRSPDLGPLHMCTSSWSMRLSVCAPRRRQQCLRALTPARV